MCQRKISCIMAALIFMFIAMPMANGVVKAESVTISWSDMGPGEGLRPQYLKKAADAVEKATEGRVKIKFHWSNSLVDVSDVPSAVRDGFADSGWACCTYHPSELGLLTCVATFLYHPKIDDFVWQTKKTFEMYEKSPELREEMDAINAKLWYVFPYGNYSLFADKKVTSLEDLKGMILRVSSEQAGEMVRAIGAKAETIPASETYSALDKGIVDGVLAGIEWGERYRFFEISKYLNNLGITMTPCVGPVSKAKLDKMRDEDRKAFMKIGREYSIKYAKALNEQDKEYREFLKEQGMEVVDFPDSEIKKWASKPEVKQLKQDWVDDHGEAGRKVMELWLEVSGLEDRISID